MSGIDFYTKLMLHMDGADGGTTFTDSSLSPKTVTRYGDAQIDTEYFVFGGTSGLFDGNGDYLVSLYNADWKMGTDDFTIDFWVRFWGPSSSFGGAYGAAIVNTYIGGSGANQGWQIRINGTSSAYTTINIYTGLTDINHSYSFSIGTWYHVAIVRNGSSLKSYVNGVNVGTTVNTDSFSSTVDNDLWIGGISDAVYKFWLKANLDELRISKGIARWTSNFTPPTSAYDNILYDCSVGDFSPTFSIDIVKQLIETTRTFEVIEFIKTLSFDVVKQLLQTTQTFNISNVDEYTKLLIHGDGEAGSQVFYDFAELHEISVVGTLPQVSSTSKFGTGSIQFTQPVYVAGNYLTVENSQDWNLFSSGLDVTIDFWINTQLDGSNGVLEHIDPVDEWGWNLSVSNTKNELMDEFKVIFECYNSDWDTVSWIRAYSSGIEHNTWNHVEVVISDNVPMIFLNGQSLTLTNSDHLLLPSSFPDNSLRIGSYYGYAGKAKIDELRISKSIARHTSNFTPPTEAYGTGGDLNSTFSMELERSFTGIYSYDVGDFDITTSFAFLRTLEKILTIGSFNSTFTRTLSKVQDVAGFIQLVNHFLVGKGLKIKFNLNDIHDIVGLLYLNNTIPDYQTVQNSIHLNNSIIVPINDSIEVLNKITSIIQGSLALKNKVSEKTEVSSTISLVNRIDPQQEVLDYFYLSEEHLG